jgi:hypothetical protein
MAGHRWKFVRVGGFDQVSLTTGADLVALGELDLKLWVALACPTKGLEFDARTLALIDTDGDGRIHAQELITAVEWAGSMLADVEVLARGTDALPLDAIAKTSEGNLLRDTARALLRSLGKADATAISVTESSHAVDAFAKQPFNGDGIVTPESTDDAALREAITDILACGPASTDKSGSPGVDAARVEAFFADVAARSAWLAAGAADAAVHPLGDATEGAFAAYEAVRAKVDDYFARCRVAGFDARAVGALNRNESDYAAIAAAELAPGTSELAGFPLAQIAAGKALPLGDGVNPAWAARVEALRTQVVGPVLGAAAPKTELREADWQAIRARFAPREAWLADAKGASVAALSQARLTGLSAPAIRQGIDALFVREKEAEPLATAIGCVEKLAHFVRDLLPFARNFASFEDFYGREKRATFQIGTLYLDTRACELCVRVDDDGRHAEMAPRANTCLVYCQCTSATGETMSIAAAMTAGDVDNLIVGRNGLFYDLEGNGWDATVTRIVDAPISVRQAFWSPYKKALRMIEEFVAKRAADAESAADAKVTGAVDTTTTAAVAGAPAPGAAPAPAAAPKPLDIGIVAALGVAVGGLSAAFGALLSAFFGLGIWMPLGVLGLLLVISGPSMAIAWMKLRRRNLGPLLDANGWALNAQARVNVAFGESLTRLATLPPGSTRTVSDPFADKRRPWGFYVALLVVAALAIGWYLGKLDGYLPPAARSVTVLGSSAPATPATTPTAATP